VDGVDLKYAAFKVGRLHLAKTKSLEVPGGTLKEPDYYRGLTATGVHGTTHVQGGPDQGARKAKV
jgi:hypothetical protein